MTIVLGSSSYDPRIPDEHIIVVSDRANSRFEFYNYDPEGAAQFLVVYLTALV